MSTWCDCLPALSITDDEIDQGCAILADVLREVILKLDDGIPTQAIEVEIEVEAMAGRGKRTTRIDASPTNGAPASPANRDRPRHFVDLFDLSAAEAANLSIGPCG